MLSLKIKTGGNLMRHAIVCGGGQCESEGFCSLGKKNAVMLFRKIGAKRPKSLPEAGI